MKPKTIPKMIKDNNVTLLLADWTKRDPVIGKWLQDHKMAGVPAYFIQKPDGTLINLKETITHEEVRGHIED